VSLPELPDAPASQPPPFPVDDLTTAPGDQPLSEVNLRTSSLRRQFRHDNTTVPLAPEPNQPMEVWASSGEEVRLQRAVVLYTVDGTEPDLDSTAVPMEAAAVDWDARTGYLTRWRATLPGQGDGTEVRYRIASWQGIAPPPAGAAPNLWAHDGQGFWFRYPGLSGITTFAYRVEPAGKGMPAWVRDAVIYQIFLDRFHPGTVDGAFPSDLGPRAIHGGTLRGVTRALPYLEELGVNCLWLSPFCPAPSFHRYDATDFLAVDPVLGTEDDLRALTGAAHERGMRVMMDFVPSHCSRRHPAFLAAQADPRAPTASWFTFERWPDTYRCFLDLVPDLPSFNTADPGARAYLIGSAIQWVRDFGIDALRLDHAIGPSMDFWVALRTATRAAAPETFTVGEATDSPDALRRYRHRLDAVLDFPLAGALRHTFALGDWDVGMLDGFLDASSRFMASGPGTVSFLDNHDMNRFLFLAGGDTRRLKLAALCLFTLEPPPTIYYGTEIGMSQPRDVHNTAFGGDAEARRDMPWDPELWDHDLLRFFRALIRLRLDHRALPDGERHTAYLDVADSTYAYVRRAAETVEERTHDLLVVFNLSDQTRPIALPEFAVSGPEAILLTTGNEVELDASQGLAIRLAPMSGTVLAVGSASV